MSNKIITKISFYFNAIKKGKRKETLESIDLDTLDGHLEISPDELNDYERKAWRLSEKQDYKVPPTKGRLQVYHGFYDEQTDIVQIMILPKQTLLLLK